MYIPSPFITLNIHFVCNNYRLIRTTDLSEVGAKGWFYKPKKSTKQKK